MLDGDARGGEGQGRACRCRQEGSQDHRPPALPTPAVARKECTRPRPHPGSCFPGQLVAWNYSLWISVPDTSGSRWGGPGRRDPSLTLGLPAREKKAAPTPLASGPSGPECVSLGSWAAARGQRSSFPLHSLLLYDLVLVPQHLWASVPTSVAQEGGSTKGLKAIAFSHILPTDVLKCFKLVANT